MNRMAFIIIALLLTLSSRAELADYAIVNGLIIDGTGAPAYQANIIIKDGIISAINAVDNEITAKKVIDAKGKLVTPGFIDLHSHGDPFFHGAFKNFLSMGVTTISLGQDGHSPMTKDLAEWSERVNNQGVGVNIAMFIGHNTLRKLAGVGNISKVTPEQQQVMHELLTNNLPGVFGMTTGLEYTPGLYAAEAELISLAKIVGSSDKLIMSHMRNEDDEALESSINELIKQGEYSRVHVSHLKSVFGKGEQRATDILKLLYEARNNKVEITADVYPYNASYTGISIVFPDWAKTTEQFEAALPERRQELAEFLRQKVIARNGPEATLLGTAPYTGKTLAKVAKELNKPFEEVLIENIGPQGASGAYFVMNDELQSRLINDPLIAVSSDGSPVSFHPRGHGTFAKFIEEYVQKRQMFAIEKAIAKVTSKPAEILRVNNRGLVKQGFAADLLIFNPAEVRATATYSEPHQLAEGFDYVFVNGQIAKEGNSFTSITYGKVLDP